MFKSFVGLVFLCIIIVVIFVYACSLMFNDKNKKLQREWLIKGKKMYQDMKKDIETKQKKEDEEDDIHNHSPIRNQHDVLRDRDVHGPDSRMERIQSGDNIRLHRHRAWDHNNHHIQEDGWQITC